jgi:RHS repeat-associated protein
VKHAALLVIRIIAIMAVTMAFTTQTASACSLNPVANITSPVNTDVYYKGEGVSLDGSTSVAMCSPSTLTYTWSVRQTSFHSWTQVYNGSNPTYLHTFPTVASTWQVRLKVTNAGSKTHTRTVTNIHVVNEPESQYHITDHLGSPRVVFNRSGTVLSWTDYYPFGGILPGRSGTSAIDHDNIKFTGYEKESEGGLDTYHAEARGYDPIDGRFTTRDPMAHKYPSWSPYAYVMNNPTNLIDPTGKDVFGIYADGTITQVKNGDTDNFFYIGDDGATTHLGTYTRNESGLIQLPSNFSVNENGVSFSFSVKVGNENETYINPQSFASLLGAFAEVGYQDVTITRFSNSDGSSPGNSTSHKQGRNGDLRYLRSDGSGEGVTVHDGVFDDQRNTSMATALTRFGYSDIKSFEKNIPMARMPIIPGTRHLDYHHDHFHLQGYRPNIQMIHYPQLFYNRP